MAVMDSVLAEELDRLEALRAKFAAEVEALPAGTIVTKRKRGRPYAYRAYREGKRVRTDYIGPIDGEAAAKAVRLADQRKTLAGELKAIDADIERIKKMLTA